MVLQTTFMQINYIYWTHSPDLWPTAPVWQLPYSLAIWAFESISRLCCEWSLTYTNHTHCIWVLVWASFARDHSNIIIVQDKSRMVLSIDNDNHFPLRSIFLEVMVMKIFKSSWTAINWWVPNIPLDLCSSWRTLMLTLKEKHIKWF